MAATKVTFGVKLLRWTVLALMLLIMVAMAIGFIRYWLHVQDFGLLRVALLSLVHIVSICMIGNLAYSLYKVKI